MRNFTLLMTLVCFFLGSKNLLAAEPLQNIKRVENSKEKQTVGFPTKIVEVVTEKCPVMGGKINKAVFSVYQDHIFYFCCPGCINAFNANPEQYMGKLENAATRILKVTNSDGKSPNSELKANLEFFRIDEETSSITFYHDQQSMEKAGK